MSKRTALKNCSLKVLLIFLVFIISPTRKRTEGRAPVWGSEFTSKDAAIQGGGQKIAARLNAKLCDLPAW